MAGAIKQCSCANPFMDARYGRQMRVHNATGKKGDELCCTSCGLGAKARQNPCKKFQHRAKVS